MLWICVLLILIVKAVNTIASPLPKYSNGSTAIEPVPISLQSVASETDSSTTQTAADGMTSDDACTTTSIPSSLYPFISGTVAGSVATVTTNRADASTTDSLNNPAAFIDATASATPTSFSFSYMPQSTTVVGSTNPGASSQATGTGLSSRSITTLTLYTTVPPRVETAPPELSTPTSIQSSFGAATSPTVAGTPQGSTTLSLGTSTSVPANSPSSLVSETASSPAVYVSLTLTYALSTNTAKGPTTLLPLSSSIAASSIVASTSNNALSSSDSAKPKTTPLSTTTTLAATSTRASFSSTAFSCPLPDTSVSPSSSSSSIVSSTTADSVNTFTSAASPSPYGPPTTPSEHPHGPPDHSAGLPNIVSQGASAIVSSGLPGITIVPINPNAVTVTVTTTMTDAGPTASPAVTTVTVSV